MTLAQLSCLQVAALSRGVVVCVAVAQVHMTHFQTLGMAGHSFSVLAWIFSVAFDCLFGIRREQVANVPRKLG